MGEFGNSSLVIQKPGVTELHAPLVWVAVKDSYSILWISFYSYSLRELGNETVMTLNLNLKLFLSVIIFQDLEVAQ